jgi:DNA-3-methyladenine glycosylase I
VSDLRPGPDGAPRCSWATSAPDYLDYHDGEWGHEIHDDDAMFERLTLEGFQSGLSWLVILRKRLAFRAAFDDFSIERVAAYGEDDVERLLADPGIVRNRAKIAATVANARAAAALTPGFAAHLWSFAPDGDRPASPPPRPSRWRWRVTSNGAASGSWARRPRTR